MDRDVEFAFCRHYAAALWHLDLSCMARTVTATDDDPLGIGYYEAPAMRQSVVVLSRDMTDRWT